MAKVAVDPRMRLASGNEACAEGALAAGCRFFAGYPITPSSELAEYISVELPKLGGIFIQMEDEMASMGAIIGASIAGMKAMTATSGPGFSLMQENIGFAAMAEVPCVVVNVMRAGPSTGVPTKPSQADVMQARWGSHGDRPVIALAPSTLLECFTLTVRAFNLSEKYRTPVMVMMDEILAHACENVIFPTPEEITVINRINPSVPPEWYIPYDETATGVPPMACFGEGYRYNITGLTHDRMGFPTSRADEIDSLLRRLTRKIKSNLRDIISVEEFYLEDAEVAVFAYGSVARVAKAAVKEARARELKVGLLRAISLWPFPRFQVERLLEKVRAVVVPEMNLGQMVNEVIKYNQGKARIYPYARVDAEPIAPEEIIRQIRKVY